MESIFLILAALVVSGILAAKSEKWFKFPGGWTFVISFAVCLIALGSMGYIKAADFSNSNEDIVNPDALGDLVLKPVTAYGNTTFQNGNDKYSFVVRANTVDIAPIPSNRKFNGSITIERQTDDARAASCPVNLVENPTYSNPSDTRDRDNHYLFDVDTLGDPKFYFESTSFQASLDTDSDYTLGFAEGDMSVDLVMFAEITRDDFANISADRGGYKTAWVDVCGEKVKIDVMKLS